MSQLPVVTQAPVAGHCVPAGSFACLQSALASQLSVVQVLSSAQFNASPGVQIDVLPDAGAVQTSSPLHRLPSLHEQAVYDGEVEPGLHALESIVRECNQAGMAVMMPHPCPCSPTRRRARAARSTRYER